MVFMDTLIHTNHFNENGKGIRKSNIAMLKDADLDLKYVPVELTKQSKEILCRAEWGNPLNDLAWVCWFTKLHYSEKALLLNTAFINEYLSHYPLTISSEQLKACCFYIKGEFYPKKSQIHC